MTWRRAELEEREKEVIIDKCNLRLSEDNILYEVIAGYIDEKLAIELTQAARQLGSMVDGKADLCINIDNVIAAEPKALDVIKTSTEDEKVGKQAFVGNNPIAVFVATQFLGITKKTNVAFFKIEEEALKWLKVRDTE